MLTPHVSSLNSHNYEFTLTRRVSSHLPAHTDTTRLNRPCTDHNIQHLSGGASPWWMYPDSKQSRAKSPPPLLLLPAIQPGAAHPAWGLLLYPREPSNLLPLMGFGPARPDRTIQNNNNRPCHRHHTSQQSLNYQSTPTQHVSTDHDTDTTRLNWPCRQVTN